MGTAVRWKEWQNSRMAEMATDVLFTVHTHRQQRHYIRTIYGTYTPTTTTTGGMVIEWRKWWNGGMAENRIAEWWNCGMVEWRNGGMAELQNGNRMAKWRNGNRMLQ